MRTQTETKPATVLSEPSFKTPITEKNPRGAGRIPSEVRGKIAVGVQEILDNTAPQATLILRKHIERRQGFRKLPSDLQRACEYVIDHAIGKARQKIEHSGGILTYGALAKSAENLERKPPALLIEVEVPIDAEVRELEGTPSLTSEEPKSDSVESKDEAEQGNAAGAEDKTPDPGVRGSDRDLPGKG